MQLVILNAPEVRAALPMHVAVEAMKIAFAQLSTGKAQFPLRSKLDIDQYDGITLIMPAYLAESQDLAVKIVSVFPDNPNHGEPTIYAAVLALDTRSGRPLALIEGSALTAIRTGAASGAATDLLARRDSQTVGLFGSGVQARTQLEAVCTVREIEHVWVYSLDRPGAEHFVEEMRGQGPIPNNIEIVDSPSQAVEQADVICTATTSTHPVFEAHSLQAGTHINAVGSFTPGMQEISSDTILKARVFVDSREAALDEAGDLIIPLKDGLISEQHIVGELGQVVRNELEGRTDPAEITLFKSVGVAVQDAIAAARALSGAQEHHLGTQIEF